MVTIKDIAREAGVSFSTVSVTLGNRGTKIPLASATREKVLAAAKKLGYRRNAIAEQIRTGKTHTVSFVTPDPDQEYISKILLGVMEHADTLGYSVKICRTGFACRREYYDRMLEMRQDAIIVAGEVPEQEYLVDSAHQIGIPVGCADCKIDSGFDVCVYTDSEDGEYAAADYLYETGYRKFAFLSDESGTYHYVAARRQGFEKALSRHGISGTVVDGKDRIPDFLRSAEKGTAVCCSSDYIALNFIMQALRAGFRVPEDIAVIGFGDLAFTEFSEPSISSVSQNFRLLGSTVAELLIQRIGKPFSPVKTTVPTTIIKMESTKGRVTRT